MNSIHLKSVTLQQRKEAIDAYLQKIVSKNGIPIKEDTSQKRDWRRPNKEDGREEKYNERNLE